MTSEGPGVAMVVAGRTARRAGRSGMAWGVAFAVYVVASSYGYASTYPTLDSRARFARSLSANTGLAALIGPARHLETVAGFTAWRTMGVLSIVGAIWALLVATRLTRGEEDEGRWELLLSGRTTKGQAALQAIAGLGTGLALLWAITAGATIAVGSTSKVRFPVSASLFLATAIVASAAMFMAVGLLAGQVATSRRQANGIGAGVLAASFGARMVADSGSGLAWLRWATPLGWTEELRPFTGSRSLPLLLIGAAIAVLLIAGAGIAARRDLGSSLLRPRQRPSRTTLLGSSLGLTVRLGWGVAAGWTAGMAVLGVVLGLVAQSASSAISGSASVEKAVGRLGGHRGGAATYVGLTLLIAAALIAFAAAGQIASTRDEEAYGHLDNLMCRPIPRRRWLAGRLAAGALFVVVASIVTGAASWAGAASQHTGLSFAQLIVAGANIAPPALFVLGIGGLLYGLRPRAAVGMIYAFVSWSLLVELLGSVIPGNRLLLDTSVISHMAPAPAANPDWVSAASLVGLGIVAAAIGVLGFSRRDLVGR